MKRLTKIDCIAFKDDVVLIDAFPLRVGEGIGQWLKNYCDLNYKSTNYGEESRLRTEITFEEIDGIAIYAKDGIMERVTLFPYLPNESRNRYKGEVLIFGKKLPSPLLSATIENYFPHAKLKKTSGAYRERFKAREALDIPINEEVKIRITMNRNPKYVGAISLMKNKAGMRS